MRTKSASEKIESQENNKIKANSNANGGLLPVTQNIDTLSITPNHSEAIMGT